MLCLLGATAGLRIQAATIVKLGTVSQITGPKDVDLDAEIAYAINFSADDPVRTVRGVKFTPDTQKIPGAALIGPQQVAPWMTKPEFGATPDDNQFEEILQDIRWANSGAGERLRATLAITNGFAYKLQILISGNNAENRRWDIRVGGRDAVDEITSLGSSPGQTYSVNRATMYTYEFVSATNSLVVEMGDLFGNNDGGDRNPIWQALILRRIFIPPTPDDLTLGESRFFPAQKQAIGQFQVTDRKPHVTNTVALVAGPGDTDNARFTIEGMTLLPGSFDFSSLPAGTQFSIRVRASDAADPTRFIEKVFTPGLVAPHAPTAVTADVGMIDPGAPAEALVARLLAADPDPFDRHTFALEAGPGDDANGLFTIAGDTLRLSQPLPAGVASVSVRVRAADLAGLSVSGVLTFAVQAPKVRLNEAVSTSIGGLPDEAGELQDWIELRNVQPEYVTLSGWYLTDNPKAPHKWQFPPGVSLPPGGFLLVLADGHAVAPPGSSLLHAAFSLGAGGEEIELIQPDGGTVVDRLLLPAALPGVAFGLGPDGTAAYLPAPTPGAMNSNSREFGANHVVFSTPHGFFTHSFTLELTPTVPGSVIRYTLDGSLPAGTKGLVYTNPIVVRPNTTGSTRGTRIVRAQATSDRAAYAPVETQTYLFVTGETGPTVDGIVSQSALVTSITRNTNYSGLMDDALLALPSVSLVMAQSPDTTERLASVELFDPAGAEEGFQIDCGVTATGTTSLASPKLSLSAKFRSDYGASKLRYPMFARGSFFPEGAATEFGEIRLRSHSHDTFFWLGTAENPPVPYGSPPVNRSGDAQLARNPWIDEMQLMMGQPGKHGRQVHLYLNGVYQGLYHIHEHADEDYMATYYPGGSLDYQFTGGGTTGSDHGALGTWRDTWNAVKQSTRSYAEAVQWIDVTNLCDYMILSFYAGNDWDWSAQHNWSAAGPTQPGRGGWKFFEQDSDVTLQDVTADCTDQDAPDGVFTAMMNLPEFRSLFRDRVYLHCYNNGALTPARAGALYDARMNEITNAIIAETARWQPSSSAAALPWDRNQEWMNEWRYLRETFFPLRTAKLLDQLRAHPTWWPLDPPVLTRLSGRVPPGYPLGFLTEIGVVYYTTNGSDPRLPGGGINPAARRITTTMTQTRLIATNATWRFLDNGTDPGPAWTGAGFDDSQWRSGPAEIGYGDGGEATVAGFVDTDPVATGIQRNITTYFRQSFNAPQQTNFAQVRLRLMRDDGAVVYLNGVEILRTNMPAGVITNGTRALVDITGTDESTYLVFNFRPDQLPLQSSGNVIAVEMHQRAPTSTDMSFALELIGLSPVPSAILPITQPTLVRARAYNGDWSALVESYLVPDSVPPASAASLVVSEIHYNPADGSGNEFLELLNTSASGADLSGFALSNAVAYTFPGATVIGPGERLVVARDLGLFGARYLTNTSPYYRAGIRVLGPWTGSLANEGESIQLIDVGGNPVLECTYGSTEAWPSLANGHGASLELADPAAAPQGREARSRFLGTPTNWRASGAYHGSPGVAGGGSGDRIVINELSPASVAPDIDGVELLNVTTSPVALGGWFVSDSWDDYRKYRIADDVVLAPGDRFVLRETDYITRGGPGCLVPFAFSGSGEQVFVVEADAAGNLLRFADGFDYGPVPRSTSLGRSPDGVGPLAILEAVTLGGSNGLPAPGYDAWAATAFPPSASAAQRAASVDLDGDGLSNAAEFAFALSPLHPDPSPLRWLNKGGGGINPTFAYRTRADRRGILYLVAVSTDLQTWDESGVQVDILAEQAQADGSVLVLARLKPDTADTAPAHFIRIRAQF
jgi:hypothetical protein